MGLLVGKAFQPYGSIAEIDGVRLAIPSYRPIVEISLTPPEWGSPSGQHIWLPAIVDTGFSGEVLIAEEHFRLLPWYRDFWSLGQTNIVFFSGKSEPAVAWDADLWIRSNSQEQQPLRIELDDGAIRYEHRQSEFGARRAPLVGARAMANAGLRLFDRLSVVLVFPRVARSLEGRAILLNHFRRHPSQWGGYLPVVRGQQSRPL